MPRVLYNKYRSSDFDQLVGQESITKILKNAVKNSKISHAYLFVGSRGTGKTSTARILAKALNCLEIKKDGNPCGKCKNCLAIAQGSFLDLIEIDAASNRGIDQIRELKEKIEFSPVEGKFKMYIVDEVHMLTKEAFNALLKTLEEPPQHVIFILATTDVHKLPPTVLSRCQRYDFRLGSEKEIRSLLKRVAKEEKVSLEEKALDVLVENAHGSYRDALSLLDVVVSGQINSEKPEEVSESEVRKILGIPDTTMVYHFLDSLVKKDGCQAIELIEELEAKGVNLTQFVNYILGTLQEILVRKLKNDWKEKEYSFADDLTPSEVTRLIYIFINAERSLRYSSIPSLVLEMIIPQVNDVLKSEKKIEEGETKSEKEQEEEEEEEEEETEEIDAKDISLEDISGKWSKVVEEIKPANGHLFAFLGGAKIVGFEKGVLKLEVPYEFHKERIEAVCSRDAINNVFKKIYGTGVKLQCIVNGNAKRKKQVSADVVLQSVPKETTVKSSKPFKVSRKVEEIFEGM